jgi:hypothetical protein
MSKNMPILTLNMNDKIYLAVSKNFSDTFAYVYTLACANDGRNNTYNLVATPQIHTFNDKSAAHVYHDTIEQLVIIHENDERYTPFFNANKGLIEQFKRQTDEYNR